MSELIAAIAGAIIGAVTIYYLDLRKLEAARSRERADEERERRRRRAALATSLLLELRNLEIVLRQLYADKQPAFRRAVQRHTYYERVEHETTIFAIETIRKLSDFYVLAREVYNVLSFAEQVPGKKEQLHHSLRCKAGFALQALPPAVAALQAEGGAMPEPRVLDIVHHPALPTIPARCFPRVLAPGMAEDPYDPDTVDA